MADRYDNSGVTVVVPTLNRGCFLLDTVADLLAQDYRPLEILIVDQSDTLEPDLDALVSTNPNLISHHRVAFRGLPIARNYGWQRAKYDLIIFVDDDIRCNQDFVSRFQVALVRERESIVGGGVDGESHPAPEHPGTYHRWLAYPSSGFESTARKEVDHVKGCNFGAGRRALQLAGGFDERLNVGAALHEETEFMLRASAVGLGVVYDGSVRLTHRAVGGGGTRQSNMRGYVYGLSHNRSVMIRRHSRWYQQPTGLLYSLKLTVSYATHYRDPGIVLAGMHGLAQGWNSGGMPPRFTDFSDDTQP